MSDKLYTNYWQSILSNIIEQLSSGQQLIRLPVKELARYGDRKSYYSNFRIIKGQLETPKNAYAQGRDLYTVLMADNYIREHFADKTIQVTISADKYLKMEILEATSPDFFTEEDFEQMQKLAGTSKVANNEEHQQVYDYLRGTYVKVGYWAKQVQQKLFQEGRVHLIQKPTNQANNFEYYQWAKIFPDKSTTEFGILAYTVTIDTDEQFVVKIDTVGLLEADKRRQKYLQVRGEYNNDSPIVRILPADQVLDKGWKYLIDLSANIILTLKPEFDSLLQLLKGSNQEVFKQQGSKPIKMSLNTILYGPPGTGKTFRLQSICKDFTVKKSVQTRREFLEEKIEKLTWWETVGAAMMQLKNSSVPNLEKHEYIQIKASQSTTKHVKQVLWGSLQEHTVLDCENVKFASRTEPLLFSKNDNSVWTVLSDRVQNEAPEIIEFLNEIENFKPKTGAIDKNYRMTTFHQSFSYEDFVEGIKPVMNAYESDGLEYRIEQGIFYQCCNDAAKLAGYDSLGDCINDTAENRRIKISQAAPYALFIDEVSRANVSSVLGELITLIEEDKRLGKENEIVDVILPYSKSKFGVPGNLYIVGTMNTADRSVEALDTALRRRFVFDEVLSESELLSPYYLLQRLWHKHWLAEPETKQWVEWEVAEKQFAELSGLNYDDRKYKALSDKYEKKDKETEWMTSDPKQLFAGIATFSKGVDLSMLLEAINKRLKILLTKDHTIGHAWLMNVFCLDELKSAFKNKILPLLQEFFYNDYAKIGLVLGSNFVDQKKNDPSLFAKFNDGNDLASEYAEKITFTLKDPLTLELSDFISIYLK